MSLSRPITFRILMDNIGGSEFLTEHGFSVWVEYSGEVVVFDTGQSDAFITNAQKLGCNLSAVNMLVLSHGHYDHTGGVRALLDINPDIKVLAHPAVLTAPRYSLHPDRAPHMIAMPEMVRHRIESLPEAQSIGSKGPFEICPDFFFSGEIPRINSSEDVGGPFFLDTKRDRPDRLPDDASLWFHTDKGLIVITGCCHSGLINTIQYIQMVSGEKRIAGIIGGLHLLHADEERLTVTADALTRWSPEFVIACHCTGSEAIQRLRQKTRVSIYEGHCGLTMSVTKDGCISLY